MVHESLKFQNNYLSQLISNTVGSVQEDLLSSLFDINNIYDELNQLNDKEVSNSLSTFNHYKSTFDKNV